VAIYPDIIVMIPKGTPRNEIEEKVCAMLRDCLADQPSGVLGLDKGELAERNFRKTVRPHSSASMVTVLASHYVRVFEEV
jgi:hypothetical protein